MNEQTAVVLPPMTPAVSLEERANRIRGYVNAARACIIEIGCELIEASNDVSRGDWLVWLEREFQWAETTARKFIRVAEAFQGALGAPDSENITIEASALYALTSSSLPRELRQEVSSHAAGRSLAGEHITKEKAEEMVREAVEARVREALEAAAKERDAAIAEKVKEAKATIRGDSKKRLERLAQLEAERKAPPDLQAVTRILCGVLKVTKLRDSHYEMLAQLLGHGISVGKKTFAPISRERQAEIEEELKLASHVTEAVQTLAGAAPPVLLLTACYPVQRALILEHLDAVEAWVAACREAGQQYQGETI